DRPPDGGGEGDGMRRFWLAVVLLVATMAGAEPDGPRYYYLGPKIDHGGEIGKSWPTGAMAGVDLSGATNNIAFYWSDHPISATGSIYGGTDLARTMGAGAKAVWSASTEVDVPAGSWTLLDLLWGSLNGWENVSGLNPIVPTSEGFLELWMPGHSLVRKEKWQGEFSNSYNRVRRLVRQSIKRAYLRGLDELEILDSITPREFNQGYSDDNPEENKYIDAAKRLVENRGLTPAEAKQFIQDYIAKKYRQFLATQVAKLNLDWRDLVDAGVPMLGPVKPQTTYTDDFNRSNSDTLGLSWTEVSGDLDISSNQTIVGTSGNTYGRYDADLSSDDQTVIADVDTSTAYAGVTARCDTDADASSDFYMARPRDDTNRHEIYKRIAGKFTLLHSEAATLGASGNLELEVNGSSISYTFNSMLIETITDTAITGNLRCGVRVGVNVGTWLDNWSAEDILTGPAIPVLLTQYRRRF
ncbi:MAG: hypothetical protein KC964_06805, partial [Candidatus Omnitrophica bacterium]|nr:hypothetical protein [Candidatus Omnitrophota bacterium]